MPCRELFEDQDEAYRKSVLPPEITACVTVEEASPLGWLRWRGLRWHRPWWRTRSVPVGAALLKVVSNISASPRERVADTARKVLKR